MSDELALEIFGILTDYEFKTLGEQKEFCRRVAQWHQDKVGQLKRDHYECLKELERLHVFAEEHGA